jgi:hypothetical protein
VGVFLKNERKFAEVRPKARSLSLGAGRVVNFIKLTCVDDIDDRVRAG